ncbi:MAG TPA: zf-HC2 domain-containing protein [Thermoanaerobaculia bacterium]|jgi:hypothetical protein|nr:zf-HC2 domain-containing protein [Thermoanaerobaculia bacterium]
MNCPQARFLLYAHLDRELSGCDAEELSRHLAMCAPCAARAESARGLAKVLRSRLYRAHAPARLRSRLQNVAFLPEPARPRPSSYFFAAAVVLLLFPLVADTPMPHASAVAPSANDSRIAASAVPVSLPLVSKHVTGTFVCIQCESRQEEHLLSNHQMHVPGFCADNGEIWRLMTGDPREFGEATLGRAATLEGTAFPQSGFLRANRVGY